MLVPLIPPPVHYLRDDRVVVSSFQRIKISFSEILGESSRGLPGRGVTEVEDGGSGGRENGVGNKVVEFEVLATS